MKVSTASVIFSLLSIYSSWEAFTSKASLGMRLRLGDLVAYIGGVAPALVVGVVAVFQGEICFGIERGGGLSLVASRLVVAGVVTDTFFTGGTCV